MGLSELIKSNEERKREKEKKRRKVIREAERARESVKDKIKELKQDRDEAWKEARNYLRDGQKIAAQRCLRTVQATEVMIGTLEQKHWVYKQYITKMEIAKADQDIAKSLRDFALVLNIDPEEMDEVLSDIDSKLADQGDIDKMWDKKYEKEMDGIAKIDGIPSVEEMMSNLEKEVVADVTGGNVSQKSTSRTMPLSEEIGAGRKKLKELLDNKK